MSSLITVCGPCADNIQKHFDFIVGGTPLNGEVKCAACHAAPSDLGFAPPKHVKIAGIEGTIWGGSVSFEVKGWDFDLSKAGDLIRDFTELSASVNAADLFAGQMPQGHGECTITVSDEVGYTISLHMLSSTLVRYMAQFGRTKRGADNE